MAIPIGANVEKLFTQYSNALEQWFDRCQRAIGEARNGNYAFEQFAKDVTDTWVSSTYVSLYPLTLLGGVSVTPRPEFPVLRFRLCSRGDTSNQLQVPSLPAAVAMEDLSDASGVNKIPHGNVTLTVLSPTYVGVALAGLDKLAIPGGLYRGNIVDNTMKTKVARVEVVLP
ncbi:MAG: hypothetical protein U0802_00765 [Candidatus Binatia bacterium]